MRAARGILCGLAANVLALAAAAPSSAQVHCTATFSLDDTVTLGALQIDVGYTPAVAGFDGSGSSVDCTNVTAALPNFQDDDAGTLALAFIAFGGGFEGPADLVHCEMTNPFPIDESDLSVVVTDAADPGSNPVAHPAVSVSLFCDGDTTTTLPPTTTTTTLPTTEICTVRVSLDDPVTVGSLQVEIDYGNASGEFRDTQSNVDCVTRAPGTLGTYFDDDVSEVGAALIKLNGFTGPLVIYECTFVPLLTLPVPGDFDLTVVDAGDPNSDPIVPKPSVSVSEIECFDPAAPTTTTTTTTTSTSTTTTVPEDLCGDADLNALINVSDAARILHAAVGLPAACPLAVCDTGGDGSLTVADAQRVLRSAIGLPSQLLCV